MNPHCTVSPREARERTILELIDELEHAKKAVQSCLDNAMIQVDHHGLAYWANTVERLRKEIQAEL